MKRTNIFLLLLCFISSHAVLHAQKVDMPQSRLEALLCRKWVMSYVLIDEKRVDPIPGTPLMSLEFKNDKTFILTGIQQAAKGTWNYNAGKKLISLAVIGGANSNIISLKEDEFVMLTDTKAVTPDDPEPIKTVFKIKE